MSVRYPHLSKSWRIAPVRDPRRDRHGLKLGSDFWKCCRNDSPVRTFSFKLEVRLWIRWHRSYSSSTERNKDSCNPKKTRTLAKVCFFLDLLTLFLWVLFSESLSTRSCTTVGSSAAVEAGLSLQVMWSTHAHEHARKEGYKWRQVKPKTTLYG